MLLAMLPLRDTPRKTAQVAYEEVSKLFERGQLIECQNQAELGYESFLISDPAWAAKLRLLEAETMLWRGLSDEALRMLSQMPTPTEKEAQIKKLSLEGAAFTRVQRYLEADQKLAMAENLCRTALYRTCADVPRARGLLEVAIGQPAHGREFFLESLAFARTHRDRFLESSALVNLGFAALQADRYDEAAEWSKAADSAALAIDARYLAEIAEGNLGWAYFQLGDHDRALALFLDAQKRATSLGSLRHELKWLENIGFVYQSEGDAARAAPVYRQALELAQRIDSKSDIATTLEFLAFAAIDAGKLDEATSYLNEVSVLARGSGNHRDELWVELARGRIAAIRQQDSQAETLFRTVIDDPDSLTSIKLEAGHQLALLDEAEAHAADAEKAYQSTLATFEQARSQLKHEDSRLPFVTNATSIYNDYVHFLVQQNRPLQALAVADQSRARTLEQGLGIAAQPSSRTATFDPRSIAAHAQATLLFYWLGEKQSYLWTVTAAKVALFTLPPRRQIAAGIESYRKALLDLRDPLASGNADGQALYEMLVAPAAAMIQPNKPVIVLDEGILSKLNFETLLVPGPAPGKREDAPQRLKPRILGISEAKAKAAPFPSEPHSSGANPPTQFHYLIDDFTLSSAPSLDLLAAAKIVSGSGRRMLLVGNPVSPDRDFPTLPMFSFEMSRVESHFTAAQISVVGGLQATPAAYAASRPRQYSYIHFVSHAVASSTNPLDSAIILSNPAGQENSYKLYAREIIQHPIDARLVTISACYGSGTRAYAGEGLVGLSWAFLRAGARKVIGALWEVSDDSTPQLMDSLYQGLDSGESPEEALRQAKLALLHSQGRFRIPFYWAPFQIYGRP